MRTRSPKFPLLFFILAAPLLFGGCQRQDATPQSAARTAAQKPARTATPAAGRIHGKVVQTIEAPGYTYVQVDTGSEKFWAAGPATDFHPGDMIAFDTSMPMQNFHSKSLDRDFNLLYFVDTFLTETGEAPTRLPEPHGSLAETGQSDPVTGITAAEGGQTIAAILAGKDSLSGKPVRVRGKVVKFTGGVLGKNWLHIKDSSTGADLTVTTDGNAGKGDTVLVEGKLGRNRDFGYGYVYDVIVEDARVSVE
ncbi:MAG TPA: DNA-binding protein [Gammaproteobacteria bacterium]|nr:DNA-binding protein [Gammaproteobacteria bacterium]